MRVLSKGRLARAIAHLLTLSFIWSTWLAGVAALPAAAQIVTRAATTQTVAVVPFENASGYRPETFGDEASTAVAAELRDRLLLDVLPKADVAIQMRDLGLTAPLSDVELVRLAAELEVALLVSGQVRAGRLLRGPEGRYGEVTLAVRLFDRIARADTNGALVTAQSPPSLEASEEVLLRKALEQAAFQAVEDMRARPTITAMVLWTRGDTVFLNVGTRGGMRPGMKLVAIRGGERIALVKVTDADGTGAYADVIEGTSLRTGDYLRAVYELPTGVRATPMRAIEKTGKRFDKLLIAAGVLFGLSGFSARARLLEEGGMAAPSFAPSNLANSAELGVTPFGGGSGSVLITWESYSNTQKTRLVGYELYRNPNQFADFVLAPGYDSGQNFYFDHSWPLGIATVDLTCTTDGTIGYAADFIAYLPTYDAEGNPNPTWDQFLASNATALLWVFGTAAIHYGWVAGGPVPGQGYYYHVKPIILVQHQLAANQYVYEFDHWTEVSPPNNFLVTVLPPFAYPFYWVFGGYEGGVYEIWDFFPNPDLVGNLATFHFYSPVGADEVIVQVTRDPNVDFDPAGVYSQAISGVTNYWTPATVDVDLTRVPGTGDVFWWRMGARNRRDSIAPRPWPLSRTNDYGYVWSERIAFTPTTLSRASLLHSEREALTAARTRGVRLPHRPTAGHVLRGE